jgi:hypothetical protein
MVQNGAAGSYTLPALATHSFYNRAAVLQQSWPQSQVRVVSPFESSQKSEQYFEPGSAGQLQAS